ncbi:MAG: isoprenyl transferase [Bacteroidia bacterium]
MEEIQSLKSKIDTTRLPKHIAIIMDGNGRWAKQQGKERVYGHQHGVHAVREASEGAAEIGVKYLTLYAFSTENWNRPKEEVDALMELLVKTIHSETATLNKNKVRLMAIGDLESLPPNCYKELMEAIDETSQNDGLTLVLALSYSSRWEIVNATKKIASAVKSGILKVEDINDELFASYLTTKNIPDPELLIRTSGELRISNFLLWQCAYAEFCFLEKMWPEFKREDLFSAILDFQQRERRFGKTSEQIKV